ncbi:hypothetical protein F4810DRAFT_334120 [Camillea tinctor]|nr:hypothetical protein F4810DRAFT_334120 [Camillea tinctor]
MLTMSYPKVHRPPNEGLLKLIAALIKAGANIDETYNTYDPPGVQTALHYLFDDAFMEGADRNRDELVRLVLGKDFNLNQFDLNKPIRREVTVLEQAVRGKCPPDTIKLMLQKGAKITPNLVFRYEELMGVLEMQWNRPEFYTPKARESARVYNPHWGYIEDTEDTEDVENVEDSTGTSDGLFTTLMSFFRLG